MQHKSSNENARKAREKHRTIIQPRTWTLEIEDVHPSLNSWTRMHFHARNRLKHEWADLVTIAALAAKLPKIDRPVRIFIEYYHPRRNIDIDNYTPKMILDPLRDRWLRDDSVEYIPDLRWTFVISKQKRTLIHITEL